MNARRFTIGTGVATIVLSATGIFIFGVLLPAFYTRFMNAGSAIGVPRQPMLWWAIAIGMLAYGALIAFAIVSRPQPLGVTDGMAIGAVVSVLMWLAADFILYGISNIGSVTSILVDPLLEAVPGALAGGCVAAATGIARNEHEHGRTLRYPVTSRAGSTR
jgi:hypothetical protein